MLRIPDNRQPEKQSIKRYGEQLSYMHPAAWTLMDVFVFSGIAVFGCSFLYKDPEVSVRGVKPTTVSLTSVTLDVDLEVTNKNLFGITLKSLSFDVYYQDGTDYMFLSHGEKDGLQVNPGTNNVTVPVTVNNAGLLRSIADYFLTGKLQVRIEGTAQPDFLLASPKIPFTRTVTLSR